MNNLTFSENPIYKDSQAYDRLIDHFNKISELHKNKKFEWEDNISGITYYFNEWFSEQKFSSRDWKTTPDDKILEYYFKIHKYIDAYILYEETSTHKGEKLKYLFYGSDSMDKIVEYLKEVKKNNRIIFLEYMFQRPDSNNVMMYYIKYGIQNHKENQND